MTTTSAPNPATPNPLRRAIGITVAVIAALVVAFFAFASLYADWLWYEQLGFDGVLTTQWIARVTMFFVGFVAMAVPVFLGDRVVAKGPYAGPLIRLQIGLENVEDIRADLERGLAAAAAA